MNPEHVGVRIRLALGKGKRQPVRVLFERNRPWPSKFNAPDTDAGIRGEFSRSVLISRLPFVGHPSAVA